MTNPPVEEPRGASARAGFVKTRPENNDYYVEQFKDHPWYPIIKQTHDRLTEIIPGYNIAQIKEKFGGLRFYIDYPETAEDVTRKDQYYVESILGYAEAWVDGFELARRERDNG